jgi:uncharacterized OsmC-like protein
MAAEEIRATLERTIGVLSENPEKGRSADKPATAVLDEGLRVRVDGPDGWSVVTDMPAPMGGGASAPTPGWVMRAALASCLASLVAQCAAQEGIELDTLEVSTESETDSRGMLGVADVPAGPEHLALRVRIGAAGVEPERLRALVESAETRSVVGDVATRAVPVSTALEIVGP